MPAPPSFPWHPPWLSLSGWHQEHACGCASVCASQRGGVQTRGGVHAFVCVSVWASMCIRISACIHVCVHLCVCARIPAYPPACIGACVCTCAAMRVRLCMCMYVCVSLFRVSAWSRVCTCIHVRICVHPCAHLSVRARVCIHVCTRMCIHVCVRASVCVRVHAHARARVCSAGGSLVRFIDVLDFLQHYRVLDDITQILKQHVPAGLARRYAAPGSPLPRLKPWQSRRPVGPAGVAGGSSGAARATLARSTPEGRERRHTSTDAQPR